MKTKRILSLALALAMVLSLCPLTAMAASRVDLPAELQGNFTVPVTGALSIGSEKQSDFIGPVTLNLTADKCILSFSYPKYGNISASFSMSYFNDVSYYCIDDNVAIEGCEVYYESAAGYFRIYPSGQFIGDVRINVFLEEPETIEHNFEFEGNIHPAHTHSFAYTAEGATITATCTEGCTLDLDKYPEYIELTEEVINAEWFTVAGLTGWPFDGDGKPLSEVVPEIKYYKADDLENPLTAKPTEQGSYKVTLRFGDATAELAYELGAAKIAGETPAYYGTLAEAVAAAKDGDTIMLLADNAETVIVSKAISIDKNGKTFTGEITAGEGYELSEKDGVVTIVEKNVSYAASLTLNENINVNFYVAIPKGSQLDSSKFSVKSTFPGSTEAMTPQFKEEKDGYSYYKAVVAAAKSYQMNEKFSVEVFYDGVSQGKLVDYSVRAYLETEAENENNSEEMRNLCLATLSYGGSAQRYFSGKSYKDGTYPIFTDEDYVDRPLHYEGSVSKPTNTATLTTNIGTISGYSASLVLGNEVSLKIYFTTENTDGLSISCSGGTVTNLVQEGTKRYSFKLTGLSSLDLSKNYVFTLSQGGKSDSITYSPYVFLKQNWEDASLSELCMAIKAYGDCATAAFPTN